MEAELENGGSAVVDDLLPGRLELAGLQRNVATTSGTVARNEVPVARRVARNSEWGADLGVWGQSPQPPEANGGLRVKAPAAGGLEFGGKALSRRRHGGLGRSPQRWKFLHFFAKITSF